MKSSSQAFALLRVTNELLMAADSGSPAILVLLDLTSACGTVVRFSQLALSWFLSYLEGRSEIVSLGYCKSYPHTVSCGVPQGSVFGPVLFTVYTIPLSHVISKHGLSFHCYCMLMTLNCSEGNKRNLKTFLFKMAYYELCGFYQQYAILFFMTC